jgi:hypothetical protein
MVKSSERVYRTHSSFEGHLEFGQRAVVIEDRVPLLNEFAFLLAGRQHHSLSTSVQLSNLTHNLLRYAYIIKRSRSATSDLISDFVSTHAVHLYDTCWHESDDGICTGQCSAEWGM